jgi:predicted DNA-binding ribbon-helix-helix protein
VCHVFASTDPELFEPQTRSVRIAGVVTSLRLETAFWRIVDDIARASDMTTGRFLSTLYDEVVELRGEVGNFASLLRVIACRWISGEVTGVPQPSLFATVAAEPPRLIADA